MKFAELREKLEAATKGEWQFVNGEAIVTDYSYDPETNRQSANWIAEIDHIDQDDFGADAEGSAESEQALANGALIVAAVNALPELLQLEDENAALRREVSEAQTKAYRNAAAFLRIQIKQERLVGKSVPERLDFCANRIQAMGAAPDTEAGSSDG